MAIHLKFVFKVNIGEIIEQSSAMHYVSCKKGMERGKNKGIYKVSRK